MTTTNNPLDHMEYLITTAQLAGEFQRFPHRFYKAPDIKGRVNYACKKLDELNVSWSHQNQALYYINCVDLQGVWRSLFARPHRQIAAHILDQNGETECIL